MAERLEVFLVTPERELWSGPATMVVARGSEGEVGILRGHAPMLLRLGIGVLRIHHEGQEERAVIDGGFLHVTTSEEATRVDVLADGATLEADIDAAQAQQRRDEAQRRIDEGDEDARLDLERAEARLALRGS
jgi:F-type H+-transporting ATPase subunit epsilon